MIKQPLGEAIALPVSIQLISLASRDEKTQWFENSESFQVEVSIQLISLASRDSNTITVQTSVTQVSIQLISLASRDLAVGR